MHQSICKSSCADFMAKIGAAQEEKKKIFVSPFTKWYG
jgi:hypothetical protein